MYGSYSTSTCNTNFEDSNKCGILLSNYLSYWFQLNSIENDCQVYESYITHIIRTEDRIIFEVNRSLIRIEANLRFSIDIPIGTWDIKYLKK